jgi:hypothetical protein
MNRRNVLIIVAILAILMAGILPTILIHHANTTLNVAPSDAAVMIDGKVFAGNKLYLRPGSHQIVAHLNGFADGRESFNVTGSMTTVTVLLNPNSDIGYSYLAKHPDQELIGGQNFKIASQNASNSTTLTKLLPYLGAGLEFRVDYGTPSQGSNSKVGIYITGATKKAQQDAVSWIQGQGYDITKLDIIYKTASL